MKIQNINQRNTGIDLLRGVSILLVIVHHVGIRLPLAKTLLANYLSDRVMNALNWSGSEAVFIFFVISGFLITRNIFARWGSLRHVSLRGFYTRRAARILPCLLALLAILSLLHLARIPGFVIEQPGQSLPHALFSALTLHLNWYEGLTGYLPANWDVLWSLSIEELFYLVFPLACLLLRWEWLMAIATGAFALTLPWFSATIHGSPVWREKAYLPGMAAIATGVLTAILTRRIQSLPRWAPPLLILLGACGIASEMLYSDLWWKAVHYGIMLTVTLSAALILTGFELHARSAMQRKTGTIWQFPGFSWLASFGRMSYEIYLTHMFVVIPLVMLWKWLTPNSPWNFFWYLPAILGSWALGWLVAHYFSNPSDHLLRNQFAPDPTH